MNVAEIEDGSMETRNSSSPSMSKSFSMAMSAHALSDGRLLTRARVAGKGVGS